MLSKIYLNSLQNDKILEKTKLKEFPDDKIDVTKLFGLSLIGQKGETAGLKAFLFPTMFSKTSSLSLKLSIVL